MKFKAIWYLGLPMVVCAGSQAEAQTAPSSQLEEIIVTASRREEQAQKVPIAISTVSATAIAQQNVTSIQGLSTVVPGLQFSSIGPNATPFIRGVGNNATGPGTEAAVATFVDGVYISAQTGSLANFNNVASIEIAKGPQGTLFGRNATGGVILINTRTPSSTPEVEASLSYSEYDTVKANAYVTSGLAPNVAADLAVSYVDRGRGWGKNRFDGSDVFKMNSFGIRSKLLLTPTEDLTITIAGDYSRVHDDVGSATALSKGDAFMPLGSTTTYGYDGFYNVNLNVPSSNTAKTYGGSVKVVYQTSAVDITSITAYRRYESFSPIDADVTPSDLIQADITQKERSFTQELLLSSADKDRPLQWIVGAFYYDNNAKDDPFLIYGSQSIFVIPAVTRSSQHTKSISGFGQVTYAVAENTHLTAGLRYTSDKRTALGTSCGGPRQLFGGPACVVETDANGNVGPRKLDSGKLTWRFGADHKLSDDVMLYGSYARGFKSGFFNISTINDPGVAPEKLDAFEIGLKSELLDRKLRLNVSGFYYKYNDLQVQTFQGTSFVVRNAAKATIKGIDFDLTARLGSHLTIGLAGQYLNARYDSFTAGPIYTQLAITTPNPFYGFGGNSQGVADLSGRDMVNAPKYSLNGNIRYDVPSSIGLFSLNVTPQYKSKFYFDPANQAMSRENLRADASIGWESNDQKLNARLWVTNLTDVRRPAAINLVPQGGSRSPLPPRTFGGTIGFKM